MWWIPNSCNLICSMNLKVTNYSLNLVMLPKVDSAQTFVVGTPMLAATSLPGLESHLLAVTVFHKQFHPMEMLESMLQSVSLLMNWQKL